MTITDLAPRTRPLGLADVAELGTVLTVWAHPDDETYLAGGLLCALADRGHRVVCVTATWGEAGSSGGERPDVVRRRRQAELRTALAILGVQEHVALGYPDGGCAAADPAPAVARLRRLIADVVPDTILTFGPDGVTGHADHRAVSGWVTEAAEPFGAGVRVLHAAVPEGRNHRFADIHRRFRVFEPGWPEEVPEAELAVHAEITGAVLDRKLAALRAQASQTGPLLRALGVARYRQWIAAESFR
jgi:LmbE family N-acetylglucosaminyl deacetylase